MASLWLLQLYALSMKNFRLMRRLRKLTTCEFLTPPIFIILFAILNASLTFTNTRVDPARTLGIYTDDSSSPLPCRVFDSSEGQYGEGMPIPGAWCVPLLLLAAQWSGRGPVF